jgi:response regulator RpfG family c-di-GMP phosphodiesterase
MQFVVVDDEEIDLFIAKRLLNEQFGVNDIHTFQKGGEALRFLKCYDEDQTITVLLDLNMPVVSGWDFLEFFNQFEDSLKSRVHIYLLTSSVHPADRIRAFSNPNVIAFISKPLTRAFIKENFRI